MALPRHDDHDDGARDRELDVMREIEQIVRWQPPRAERAADARPAAREPSSAAGPDDREGLSRRRPTGG
jgi:hypothetical protein